MDLLPNALARSLRRRQRRSWCLSSDACSLSTTLEKYSRQLFRVAEHHGVAGVNGNYLLHTAERRDARTLGFLRQGPVSGGKYPGAWHVVGKSVTVHGFSWYPGCFGIQPRHRQSALLPRHAVAECILRGHAWNLER